jgi:uncharacterized protein YdiU (UPF0061 family)
MKFLSTNTYADLNNLFYEKALPKAVLAPKLFLWNTKLAAQLMSPSALHQGADELAQIFSGNRILPGSNPIATTYAGHQFGYFNPQLGDGRAHLLGEVSDNCGKKWDIQLKGSGPTPFSRGGDGRCALGPAVREFVMSEAMYALGVSTTRCLAVVTTGENVHRQMPLPGAIVTRVASSHLRVGNFEFFASRGDLESLQTLSDYAIERHYPELKDQGKHRFPLLLDKVIEKQLQLIVEWMRVGFIHGVMNTDNTAISGETIDYGPCAMMGVYDPQTVYSSIDHMGRYAFGQQPEIAQWNMARFAECILLLIDKNDRQTIGKIESMIADFPERFSKKYIKMLANKFGIISVEQGDEKLVNAILQHFKTGKMDYTLTFDLLTKSLTSASISAQIKSENEQLFAQWRARIDKQKAAYSEIQALMRRHNPVVIPRNHYIEEVIHECTETGIGTSAEQFLEVLRCPYEESSQTLKYQAPPSDKDQNYQTFCGT